MRREIYIWLLFGWLSIPLAGQTVLYPGDFAIVGIQTDNPDDFNFVFLTSIEKNTVVYFTDCGVKADGSFRNGEGGLRYTAPFDLVAGTLVNYIRDSTDFSKANDPILGNRGFNLSSSGDQIIAFQDSSIHPRFLFAIQTNSSKWQRECTSTNTSGIPPGLMDGYSAISAGKDTGSNNYWHNAAIKIVLSGKSKNTILNELGIRNNWSFSNSIISLPDQDIVMTADSNRFIKLMQDSSLFYFANDSFEFKIDESNISRLDIWVKNLNTRDSVLIENHWPESQKSFKYKFPSNTSCDSFKFVISDADFPGFILFSKTSIIKDTISLRFIKFSPNVIKSGDSITLIFNKNITTLYDSLIIRNQANRSDSIILSVSSGDIALTGFNMILRLKKSFAGTTYIIEIKKGWLSDMSGNPFYGFDENSYPSFDIIKQINRDSIPPAVITINPDLNKPIPLNQNIQFVFDERLYSVIGTITDTDVLRTIISVHDSDGLKQYDFRIEFDSTFSSFSILPLGLQEGKAYIISFFGFSDSTGNACSDLNFSFEIEKNVGAKNRINSELYVSVCPNPARNVLQILGNNLLMSKITIVDINGKVQHVIAKKSLSDKVMLDISKFSPGIYFIIIDNNKAINQVRFVKE
jgi:hypothetical protein